MQKRKLGKSNLEDGRLTLRSSRPDERWSVTWEDY